MVLGWQGYVTERGATRPYPQGTELNALLLNYPENRFSF